MDIAEEQEFSAEIFNMCCNWLSENGHKVAAQALADHINTLAAADEALSTVPTKAIEDPSVDRQQLALDATAKGYTGDCCVQCNSFNMRRNGTCLLCENCGATTGCS